MLMDFVVHDNAEREVIRDYISRLPQGKTYDVSIKLHRTKRSTEANALYWKWIGIIASETGNEREDCHKFLAKKFLVICVNALNCLISFVNKILSDAFVSLFPIPRTSARSTQNLHNITQIVKIVVFLI
jgi:hypothetical protein